MERKFLKYDWFKLIVFSLLALLLILGKKTSADEIQPNQISETNSLENSSGIEIPETQVRNKSLPDFPKTDVELTLDQEKSTLNDQNGITMFALNENGEGWVPVLPEKILDELGQSPNIFLDESNNWAAGETGNQYALDLKTLTWKRLSTESEIGTSPNDDEISKFQCQRANPSRINKETHTVRVVSTLIPLRASPDAVSNNILRELPPGTELIILSDPVCTPYLSGANLWWQVETNDGNIGWAAEGSAISPRYYLEQIE